MKRRTLIVGFLIAAGCAVARAEPFQPAPTPVIPFETVSGTVQVRLNGAPVNPAMIRYTFTPVFTINSGGLTKTDEGAYFMRADNVPKNAPYTLTITGSTNDTQYAWDGTIQKPGRTYSGMTRIAVPYGGDFDFGVQFLDLK